jgi:uncharacterized protein YecT (DUF1311 family)
MKVRWRGLSNLSTAVLIATMCMTGAVAGTDAATPSAAATGKNPAGAMTAGEWQKVCERYRKVPFPAKDRPTAADAASLSKCSSYELYYGVNQKADPVKARLCAYREMDGNEGDGPFSGPAMLMTIYANGVGAKRNLPLAINLACGLDGAPAEMEGRVAHLEGLLVQKWQGKDFSLCDDITSGLMQGYCADHFDNFDRDKREKRLELIQKKWPAAEKSAFALLEAAASRYFNARVENEVDQMGTARAALATEENAALQERFVSLLQELNAGKLPKASPQKYRAADAELNAVYRQVQGAKDPDLWGTVTKEGIRTAQREWIRYRDAWVKFCGKKYPGLDPAGIKTILTAERTKMLKEFVE